MVYHRRLADPRLEHLIGIHPAVLVEGLRGTGKTTSAMRQAASVLSLDDPVTADLVRRDFAAASVGLGSPVLVDEWQRVPSVWDEIRRSIDRGRTAGSFLITGSSRAALSSDVHAGAGRIVTMPLEPMTLSERRGEVPAVSLAAIAEGGIDVVRRVRSPFSPEEQRAPMLESGLPGYLGLSRIDHQEALRSYLDLSVSRDLVDLTGVVRDITKVRRYLRAYGATVGTITDHATIYNAAGVAKATAEAYHDMFSRVRLVDELPGWSNNRLQRLNKAPKRILTDPALAAADHYDTHEILGRSTDALGCRFEAVVAAQIRAVGRAQGLGWRYSHLRTKGGEIEIDLIIDLPDGGVLAIESKASEQVVTRDARHLFTLRDRLGDAFRAGMVVHPGTVASRIDDRIAAVPLGALV